MYDTSTTVKAPDIDVEKIFEHQHLDVFNSPNFKGRYYYLSSDITLEKPYIAIDKSTNDVRSDVFTTHAEMMRWFAGEVVPASEPAPEAFSQDPVVIGSISTGGKPAQLQEIAVSVLEGLVPKFGELLEVREPGKLAAGYPHAIQELITKSEISRERADFTLAHFDRVFSLADKYRSEAEGLAAIEDEPTADQLKLAKDRFLLFRDVANAVEKGKEPIKRQPLRECQFIDAVVRVCKESVEPIRDKYKYVMEYPKRVEEERLNKLADDRAEMLAPYVDNPKAFDLRNMNDEAFDTLLSGQKELFEARQAQRLRDEQEEIHRQRSTTRGMKLSELGFMRDVENARYILENELIVYNVEIENDTDAMWHERMDRLTIQSADVRAKAAELREEGRRAAQEKEDRERAERDAEFKAKREAEAKSLAPDKDKLEMLAKAIESIELPEVSNDATINILGEVKGDIYNLVAKLRRRIDQLPK